MSVERRAGCQDREGWCWAERGPARRLVLEEGIHPLMHKPSALSVALDGRGAFISGRNASGKSTFLRMVGLNLVLARILAEEFEPLRIDTSSGRPVLKPGVLRDPNGIALLATQGFGPEIEGRAAEVARWLSAHLAQHEDATAA